MIGRSIGHYEILEQLGAGGMGLVYKARDMRLRRLVALKLLQRHNSASAKSRMLREAQAASALNHPNIVTVFDIGEWEESPYIVMEFVQGHPLNRMIPARGMQIQRAHGYTVQLADALLAAHDQGIVHRDLKPSNIVVSPEGKIKILDFGLAKFLDGNHPSDTDPGVFLGTVGYVSPEQAMGKTLEPRTDVFSLGVVLHEMLTGSPPFAGRTHWAIVDAIVFGSTPSVRKTHAHIPECLDTLVQQMLQKNVEDRPTAALVLRALRSMPESMLVAETGDAETVVAPPSDVMRKVTTPSASRAPELAHIAVLPFRALRNDDEELQLTEGIAAELSRALYGVPGICVVSPLHALRLTATGVNVEEVARSLNIRFVLSGSLRRAGNRIRVIAQLEDTESGLQLWSQSYDRTLDDFFGVQEELAQVMAAAVSGQLIRARAKNASVVPDDRVDAMVLVRRAYHSINTAYHAEAMSDAVGVLRKAIRMDPNFALAHAFLGFFLTQLLVNNVSDDTEADRAEAFHAANTALRLAPGDTEVLENCGLVFLHCGRHDQVEQTLRRSAELAPMNLVAWGYLALYLGWSNESAQNAAEGHAIIDRILKTAPDHPSLPYWLYFKGGIYTRQGLHQQALECCRRSVALQPRFPASIIEYANALGNTGHFEEARELAGQMAQMIPRASQESYMRELLFTTGSRERSEPHLTGLIAAGIFKGDLPWPVISKPSLLSASAIST